MPMPFQDKTGQTFGFWTAIDFVGRDKRGKAIWKCKCICGNEKNVLIGSLMGGHSKSCGCLQYTLASQKNTKHGMAKTPTYKSWHAMIQRCEGKGGHKSYPDRGISVCEEWMSFNNFLNDMGERPKRKTLDRIDNTKGYSKNNCQWSTNKQQSNNRKNTIYVTVNGVSLPFTEACEKFNIGESCARHRLRKGMSHQEIFTLPVRKFRHECA